MEKELTTINVSLPTPMRSYLETKVKVDGYGSISDLIRTLIREDQKRQAQGELERRLLESLDSGDSTPLTKKDFEDIRSDIRRRASLKNAKTRK